MLGGDAKLGLPGMWFTWCDSFDVITAWRRVGIAGNRLVPDMIDRSEFIPRGPAEPATPATPGSPVAARKSAVDVAKTPEGVQSGSLEAAEAKVTALLSYAQGLEAERDALEAERDAPFDPAAAGVLVPDVVTRPERQKPAGRKRLTDMHGSVTMRGVGDEAKKRRLEDEAKSELVQAGKRLRLEKREAEERAAAEHVVAFARCEAGCSCVRGDPMPIRWVEALSCVRAQEGLV